MLSYIGMGHAAIDASLAENIASAIGECEMACGAKGIYSVFGISAGAGRGPISVNGTAIELSGSDVRSRLFGARAVVIGAVTLGLSSENWLRRQKARSLSSYMLADAAASALVESAAEALERTARDDLGTSGWCLGPRFSPGYGDLPIDIQGPILDSLDAERQLGIRLTEEHLMIPAKSITFISGVSENGSGDGIAAPQSCAACPNRMDCDLLGRGCPYHG